MFKFSVPARGAEQTALAEAPAPPARRHLLFPGFSFPPLSVLQSTAGCSGSRGPWRQECVCGKREGGAGTGWGRGRPCMPRAHLSGEITVKGIPGHLPGELAVF